MSTQTNAQALLAVIDRLIGNTRMMAGLTGDPRTREHLREGEQARAAVAELIEAVRAIRATRGGTMALGAQDARTVRLWAALARVSGGES